MKRRFLLSILTVLIVVGTSLSTFAFASSPTNVTEKDKAFTIPMNGYCDTTHTTNFSIDISNLSGDNAIVILKLFKKDGSQLTLTGSSSYGIESNIVPGMPITISANATETYHISFGGDSNLCTERAYYGAISTLTDSKLLAGGWVDGTIGNATLIINNGQPWDSEHSILNIPVDNCSIIDPSSLIHALNKGKNENDFGIASSSSYNADFNSQAFRAFDNSCAPFETAPNQKTGWLAYEFKNPQTVNQYSIRMKQNDPSHAFLQTPKSWQFQAFDEQTQAWVTLDAQSNITNWTVSTPNVYSFTNTTPFKKYRFNFTANNGGNLIDVSEVGMMNTNQ